MLTVPLGDQVTYPQADLVTVRVVQKFSFMKIRRVFINQLFCSAKMARGFMLAERPMDVSALTL